jgi:DNA mismatch repair protein MutL
VRDRNPVILLKEIIHSVIEAEKSLKHENAELLALSLSKSAAIRPGQSLSVEEMESIAASLFSLESNNLTPEGKIIMSVLTDNELNKRFRFS